MDDRITPRIAAIAINCRSSITDLLVAATDECCCARDILAPRDVEQIQDRFNQWAGNLGALQPFESPLSLEQRLRDAPLVRESIINSLSDLDSSVQAGKDSIRSRSDSTYIYIATDIALGKRENRTTGPPITGPEIDLAEYDLSSSESDSSSLPSLDERNVLAPTSEMQELMSAIWTGLDSLFKASIFIRKFASQDKRVRAAETKPFDNRADVMYINDRYPLLNKNPTLVHRLGEANARRRQYFKYRRDHDERLSTVAIKIDSENVNAQPLRVVKSTQTATKETISTRPADTQATPFMAEAAQTRMLETSGAPEAMSAVSFATSVVETSDEDLSFPSVPAEADTGSPVLCPYCFEFQQFNRKGLESQWRCAGTNSSQGLTDSLQEACPPRSRALHLHFFSLPPRHLSVRACLV